nr:peptidoglycan-binding protein [Streptomyces sp. SID7834]
MSEDEGRRSGNPPEVEALRAALVRLKQEKGLSLTALAHDSHISRSTWNRVLRGESFPPRKEIERLSRKTRFEAQHLVGLWETADAAIKQAAATTDTTDGVPPIAPDGDTALGLLAAASAVPAPVTGSTAPMAATAATVPGDAVPEPGEPTHPKTGTVARTGRNAAPSATGGHGQDATADARAGTGSEDVPPSVPPAASSDKSVPPRPDTEPQHAPSAPKSEPGAKTAASLDAPAGRAPGRGATNSATGRWASAPTRTPAPAPRASKAAKLAILFLALLVVLLVGRWAALPDAGKDDTATPGAQVPGATGNADEGADGGDLGGKKPPQDTPRPHGVPTAGRDNTPQDLPTTSPDASPEPGASPGNRNPPPSAGQTPQEEEAPPASPDPTTATTDAALGAAGRTACAHYKPNRRVILAKGMVGTNVAQVQCLLNHNYDYNLTEDGKFGTGTEAGVKAIQQCSGITADGKVGPDTWKYLDYPTPTCGH